MLTTEAEDAVGHIHDRMPLMVERDRWAAGWTPTIAEGRPARPAGARPPRAASRRTPSRPLVSNVRNNGPELRRAAPARGRRHDRATEPLASTPRTARRGWSPHRARSPVATLLLSHGAGDGIDTRDLEALAAHLPRNGVTVVRFEQPWRVAGRKVATAAADPRRRRCVAAADRLRVRTPLVVGGRSAGARSAARCAAALGAAGCLALAFPLHPPGPAGEVPARRARAAPAYRPWWSRASATRWAGPRSSPDRRSTCASCPAADHGFKVPGAAPITQDEAMGSWSSRRWSGSCARSSGNRSRDRRPVAAAEACVLATP